MTSVIIDRQYTCYKSCLLMLKVCRKAALLTVFIYSLIPAGSLAAFADWGVEGAVGYSVYGAAESLTAVTSPAAGGFSKTDDYRQKVIDADLLPLYLQGHYNRFGFMFEYRKFSGTESLRKNDTLIVKDTDAPSEDEFTALFKYRLFRYGEARNFFSFDFGISNRNMSMAAPAEYDFNRSYLLFGFSYEPAYHLFSQIEGSLIFRGRFGLPQVPNLGITGGLSKRGSLLGEAAFGFRISLEPKGPFILTELIIHHVTEDHSDTLDIERTGAYVTVSAGYYFKTPVYNRVKSSDNNKKKSEEQDGDEQNENR